MISYERLKKIIEENLINFLPDTDSKIDILKSSMKYAILGEGKRIRPVLLLASAIFADGKRIGEDKIIERALPFAIALEYIHSYSLVHDDLPAMDNDDIRRGKESTHKKFGEAIGILCGDALLNTAFENIVKTISLNFDDKKRVHRELNAALTIAKNAGTRGMIGGQVADILEENKEVSEEMLVFVHSNKTAALFKASTVAGAFIGDASKEVISDFEIFGENLGLAFQISDDILDYKKEKSDQVSYVNVFGIEKAKKKLEELTDIAIGAIKKYSEEDTFFIDIAKKLKDRNE